MEENGFKMDYYDAYLLQCRMEKKEPRLLLTPCPVCGGKVRAVFNIADGLYRIGAVGDGCGMCDGESDGAPAFESFDELYDAWEKWVAKYRTWKVNHGAWLST